MNKELIEQLLQLNVNEKTEKKNNLTYLSWAWAWAETLKACPTATYEIKKNEHGIPAFGNSDLGYMCYTSVTIDDITHEMWLPVMDNRNKAIKTPDMFDVNKTLMRCLTKNLAMFGLGLYIYSGEDLPESVPTNIDCSSLIVLANQKGKTPKAVDATAIKMFKHGLEYITQAEHDQLLSVIQNLPDKEDKGE